MAESREGWWTFFWGVILFPLLARPEPVEVRVAEKPPRIDGVLVEWGNAERIPVEPGGENVGMRGAFGDETDFEVDAYLLWDADFLYAAVVVRDDTADVVHIPPEKQVWNGPDGTRKDAMFYYDHLKVFLRGPDAPLGFNLWVAPSDGVAPPYWWGGWQREAGSEEVPVRVGSTWKGGFFSYELAFPWEMLKIHPKPGMDLDAMFLLPDSDAPGVRLSRKIGRGDKWIWWKGKVRLSGKPPGWKPERPPAVVEEIERKMRAIALPEPRSRPGPKKERKRSGKSGLPPVEEKVASVDQVKREERATVSEDTCRVEERESRRSGPVRAKGSPGAAASLRALFARKALGRTQIPPAPEEIRALGAVSDLSGAQVDSIYHRLIASLRRLTRSGVNGRTDGLVMELADYAGVWRSQVRAFLVALLERTSDAARSNDRMRSRIAAAASKSGVEERRAVLLVEDLCGRALEAYRTGTVRTTRALMRKAGQKAGMEEEAVREFIRALIGEEE